MPAPTLRTARSVAASGRRGAVLVAGGLRPAPRPRGAPAAWVPAPRCRTSASSSRGSRRGLECRASAAVEPVGAAAGLNNVAPLPTGLVTQPAAAPTAAAAAAAAAAESEARVAAAVAAAAASVIDLPPSVAPPAAASYSWDEEDELGLVEGHVGADAGGNVGLASRDELEGLVHDAFAEEIVNIENSIHAAFEQEKADFELGMSQTVADAVESAVADALLDRTFDVRANLNTMVALSGVILYWRGLWNLFDMWLGTDDLLGNVGSLVIGLSVILLFRIFKLPLAEFW